MALTSLIEEALANLPFTDTDALISPDPSVEDASGGRCAPSTRETAAGAASNAPPDQPRPEDDARREDPSEPGRRREDPSSHQDSHEEWEETRDPTNRERKSSMWESIVIDGVLGVIGNFVFGGVTETISVGSSAGEALGKGVIELDKNYHEDSEAMGGMGGSSKGGKEALDAAFDEMRTEPWPRRKR